MSPKRLNLCLKIPHPKARKSLRSMPTKKMYLWVAKMRSINLIQSSFFLEIPTKSTELLQQLLCLKLSTYQNLFKKAMKSTRSGTREEGQESIFIPRTKQSLKFQFSYSGHLKHWINCRTSQGESQNLSKTKRSN